MEQHSRIDRSSCARAYRPHDAVYTSLPALPISAVNRCSSLSGPSSGSVSQAAAERTENFLRDGKYRRRQVLRIAPATGLTAAAKLQAPRAVVFLKRMFLDDFSGERGVYVYGNQPAARDQLRHRIGQQIFVADSQPLFDWAGVVRFDGEQQRVADMLGGPPHVVERQRRRRAAERVVPASRLLQIQIRVEHVEGIAHKQNQPPRREQRAK